jgi:hypothetical protein
MGIDESSLGNNGVSSAKKPRADLAYELPGRSTNYEYIKEVMLHYMVESNKGEKALGAKDFDVDLLGFPDSHFTENYKFLTEMGLLTFVSKGKYIPTQKGVEFGELVSIDEEDKAKNILREIIYNSWISAALQKITTIKHSTIIPSDIVKQSLANSANANSNASKKRIDVLISFLEALGILEINSANDEITICIEKNTDNDVDAPSVSSENNSLEDKAEESIILPQQDCSNPHDGEIKTKNMNCVSSSKPSLQINANIDINFEVTAEMSAEDVKEKLNAIMDALKDEARNIHDE